MLPEILACSSFSGHEITPPTTLNDAQRIAGHNEFRRG